jgi:hypothetical protein
MHIQLSALRFTVGLRLKEHPKPCYGAAVAPTPHQRGVCNCSMSREPSSTSCKKLSEVNSQLQDVLRCRGKEFFQLPPDQHAESNGSAAGARVCEQADTWAFSWLPAIEEFLPDRSRSSSGTNSNSSSERNSEAEQAQLMRWARGEEENGERVPCPGSIEDKEQICRRKRSASTHRSSRSYNSTLLADKSFHNPHATEAMAEAFGVYQSLSFAADVAADGVADKDWFYDDLRRLQNKDWVDSRLAKGVSSSCTYAVYRWSLCHCWRYWCQPVNCVRTTVVCTHLFIALKSIC